MTTSIERVIFNVELRPDWSASTRGEFIAIESQSASAMILKSDVCGYGIEEIQRNAQHRKEACVSVLVKRFAIYRFWTVNIEHARQLYLGMTKRMLERPPEPELTRRWPRKLPLKAEAQKGIDALNEDD